MKLILLQHRNLLLKKELKIWETSDNRQLKNNKCCKCLTKLNFIASERVYMSEQYSIFIAFNNINSNEHDFFEQILAKIECPIFCPFIQFKQKIIILWDNS